MSAFYAVAYEDRVEIATDGAIYDDAGTVVRVRPKAWHSPSKPLAFAGRGNQVMVDCLAYMLNALSGMGSVDLLLDQFAAALARNVRLLEMPVDGVIGSISDVGKPQLHWFTTYDGFEGYEPLVLYDVGPEWAGAPVPSQDTLAKYGFPERMAHSTLSECAADLFEAFRHTPMQHLAHPDKPLLYAVGGHVDLTIVRPEGCTMQRLREWPDAIGEKIRPEPGGKGVSSLGITGY